MTFCPTPSRRTFLAGTSLVVAGAAAGWPDFAWAAGGTAILGIDSDPQTLNLGTTSNYSEGDVGAKILEGLVWIDRDYNPKPSLATKWSFTPDGKTYTFTLRPNVKWHDGKDFTADDVVFTFNEILVKYHPRASAVLKRLDAKVSAPDPMTVTIALNKSYAPFLQQLTVFDAPILPKHLYAGADIMTNPANLKPVGTGPFVFTSWDRGSAIKVSRNPNYWGKPLPGLDAIVFQIIPQPANRITALQTGDIDEILDFYTPKPDEPRLATDPKLQTRQGVNIPAIYFVMFNMAKPAFANVKARQAIAFAIDRNRLVKQVMSGLATPGYGAFGDGFGWMLDKDSAFETKYPLDPAKAKAMLAEAGVAPNTKLNLLYDAARPQMVATAQIVRENLRAVGIDVDLQPLEKAVLVDKVFTKRDFDMTLQSYFSAGDPAIGYHRLYLTENGRTPNTNASGYTNPTVDKLFDEAATEPDSAKRADLYRQLQKILNVDLPSLVLYDEKTVDTATKKLTKLWPALDARDQWAAVEMSS